MEKKNATRKDIALRAGTTVSVVSRALNNSGYVAKEKKERILRVAEELNYVPNPVAISLQKRRTKQVLFYCKNLDNAFNIQLYQGMMDAAADRGYMVLFNGKIAFEEIKNTLVDGILMQDQSIAKVYMDIAGRNYHLPVVSAAYSDSINISQPLPIVDIDMFKVVETALDYLWKNGHRRIALGMPYPYDSPHARTIAYKSWTHEKGVENPRDYYIGVTRQNPILKDDERLMHFREEMAESSIIVPEDFFGKGQLAAHIFVEKRLDATAILGFNDDFSLGLIKGFQELGIHVPENVSVMGIDGINSRKYISPMLSTVALFPEKQGAKCVEVLLDIIEGKKFKYVNHSGFKLIEAESVRKIHRF
ncbi:LacI family DNA-binding transcriptional regulator [Eisenbergiella sp.]